MLKNYWKIAIRNLVGSKLHSTINIIGLALGMAAATLLVLNILHGLSIDQFHAKKTQLYLAFHKQIQNGQMYVDNTTAAPLAAALKPYPGIRNVARMQFNSQLLRYQDKKIPAYGE